MIITDFSNKYNDIHNIKILSLMNRRYKTELTERHLNYELDYDSIIVVNEEENRNTTPQALFSL